MKYTFVDKDGKQRTVSIPDEYISSNKKNLGCSTKEAIDMYLSDEGYIENETVRELTEKAKGSGVKVKSTKRKSSSRKPDHLKRSIIVSLEEYLRTMCVQWEDKEDAPQNVEIKNIERIISFEINGDTYELTLSKKRK